jgi:hypothetical protein
MKKFRLIKSRFKNFLHSKNTRFSLMIIMMMSSLDTFASNYEVNLSDQVNAVQNYANGDVKKLIFGGGVMFFAAMSIFTKSVMPMLVFIMLVIIYTLALAFIN